MLAEIKQLQSENQKLKDKMAKAAVGDVLSDVVSVGDYTVYFRYLSVVLI